jgi:hypothetical protein
MRAYASVYKQKKMNICVCILCIYIYVCVRVGSDASGLFHQLNGRASHVDLIPCNTTAAQPRTSSSCPTASASCTRISTRFFSSCNSSSWWRDVFAPDGETTSLRRTGVSIVCMYEQGVRKCLQEECGHTSRIKKKTDTMERARKASWTRGSLQRRHGSKHTGVAGSIAHQRARGSSGGRSPSACAWTPASCERLSGSGDGVDGRGTRSVVRSS